MQSLQLRPREKSTCARSRGVKDMIIHPCAPMCWKDMDDFSCKSIYERMHVAGAWANLCWHFRSFGKNMRNQAEGQLCGIAKQSIRSSALIVSVEEYDQLMPWHKKSVTKCNVMYLRKFVLFALPISLLQAFSLSLHSLGFFGALRVKRRVLSLQTAIPSPFTVRWTRVFAKSSSHPTTFTMQMMM